MRCYFTGNYTVDFIAKEFKKQTKKEVIVGEYCQYFQDFMLSNSKYNKSNSQFTILFLDGEELLYSLKSIENIKSHISQIVEYYLANNPNKYFVISNIYIPLDVNSLWNYNKLNNLKLIQAELNLFLNNLSVIHNNIYIFDLVSLIEFHGQNQLYDNSMWIYSRNRFNKKAISLISEDLISLINSILSIRKKCLVLDLDNTLWGGVIGEDGMRGIQISQDGIGHIYSLFQEKILKIKEKGILLAICSKNNLEDAKEVFDNNDSMVLKWDDFILHKVNWNLKNINVSEIAKELNIGEDSLVFIDDNPMERELVRNNTQVIVPEFPKNIEELDTFIVNVDKQYFSIQNLQKEDIKKTELYKENKNREIFQNKFENYTEFINSLDIELTVYKNKTEQIQRISQMTQKTNQFNFTTKRYDEEQISFFMHDNKYQVYTGSVTDIFGDFGIVILAVVKKEDNKLVFDTLLMSCRVIGKLIEEKFIEFISKDYKKIKVLEIEYLPTKKNMLVENKMENIGFNCIVKNEKYKIYQTLAPLIIDENLKIKVKISE